MRGVGAQGFGVEGCAVFVYSGFGGLVPGVVGSQRCKVLGELLSVGCRFGLVLQFPIAAACNSELCSQGSLSSGYERVGRKGLELNPW